MTFLRRFLTVATWTKGRGDGEGDHRWLVERAEPINSDEDAQELDMIEPTEWAADDPLLAFGSGAGDDDHDAATAESDESSLSGDDLGVDLPGIPTGVAESHSELPDEYQDAAGTDSGAPGLLEHVAEAVGDLWDDTTDVVT